MLTFKFYFSFLTALLYITEFELHSNPVKLVVKVFIISNTQGIIPKETGSYHTGSHLMTESWCQFSDAEYSAFPTRSGISHLTVEKSSAKD